MKEEDKTPVEVPLPHRSIPDIDRLAVNASAFEIVRRRWSGWATRQRLLLLVLILVLLAALEIFRVLRLL